MYRHFLALIGDELRLLVHYGIKERRLHLPSERQLPGEHLEENDPQGPDVRSMIRLISQRLFRAHVGNSTNRHARPCHPGGIGLPGEPEVHQLDLASTIREHDIARLDVPVDDPLPVGSRERGCELGRYIEGFRNIQGASLESFSQGLTLIARHHHE